MNLDPCLTTTERVGSVLLGLGVVAYALFAMTSSPWLRGFYGVLGVILFLGGVGGT